MAQSKSKMPIVLVIVAVLAVLSNWNFIFGDGNSKKNDKAKKELSDKGKEKSDKSKKDTEDKKRGDENKGENPENQSEKPPDYKLMKEIAEGMDWGNTPFGNFSEVKKLAEPKFEAKKIGDDVPGEEPQDLSALVLGSILITEYHRSAVINGQILTEGDFIEGSEIKVIKIKEDSVMLDENGNIFELKIKDFNIPMTNIKTILAK